LRPHAPGLKKSLAEAATAYHSQMSPDALEYLARRGLGAEVADAFLLGHVSSPLDGHDHMAGRLVIPHIGPAGNVYDLRFRCIAHEDCKEAGCKSKYMGLPGLQTRTFNTRAIALAGDELHVTEGEIDAMSLAAAGFQAIGIPGVNALPKHFPRMVAGFSSLTLWADGDDAGRGLAERVARVVPTVRILVMRTGMDVNSILMEGGADALRKLNAGESDFGPEKIAAGVAGDKYAGDPPF